MPYTLRKLKNKNCYKVYNRNSRKLFSNCTTKEKAMSQIRLLQAIQYNKDFVPNSSRRKTQKKRK